MHYARKLKYGDVHFTKRTPWGETQKFLDSVKGTTERSCITWPYGKTAAGYGRLQTDGVELYAHRCSAEAQHGPAPKGYYAAHTCGEPSCVNPNHLYWATPAENSADKLKHGTAQRGEKHGQSLLTEGEVKIIFSLKGEVSQPKLADRFGVTQPTISDIHTGRTWGWLTG